MKFRGFRCGAAASAWSAGRWYGTVTRAIASLLAYQATIAPSPGPITWVVPLVVDAADRLVGRRPLDPAGDILGAAVGVACADQDLLALADLLNRPGRQDLELLDARVAVARRCCAGADPLAQDAVFGRAGPEPHAPLVGDRAGGLGQEQAPARVGELDAPAAVLLDDVEVIGRRIIAPQREPEAPFAGQGAMAGTRVAALFRQHRLDVIAEAPRERLLMPVTTTLAVAICAPTLAVIVAWPSWTGVTMPSATVATLGSLDDHSIPVARWRPTSPRSISCTIKRLAALGGAQGAFGGNRTRRVGRAAAAAGEPVSDDPGEQRTRTGPACTSTSPQKRLERDLSGIAYRCRFGSASSLPWHSEELLDLSVSEIDERERPARRPGKLGFEVEAQAVEDRRGDVGRFDGPVRRHGADRIAGPDHPAPLNAAAGETDREAERPVVAPAGRVDAGRAPELGQVAHQRRIEHAPLRQGPRSGRCRPGRTSGRRCRACPRST